MQNLGVGVRKTKAEDLWVPCFCPFTWCLFLSRQKFKSNGVFEKFLIWGSQALANVAQLCQGLCSTTRSKDPLEFPPKRKRAGLRALCAVMDGWDRITSKGKNWSCAGLSENGCAGHVYPRWCQGPLVSRNPWIFHFRVVLPM